MGIDIRYFVTVCKFAFGWRQRIVSKWVYYGIGNCELVFDETSEEVRRSKGIIV
jgi:hypothetical protein